MKNLLNPLFVHDVKDPVTELPKRDGASTAVFVGEGQPLPEPSAVSLQTVSPKNIGFVCDISKLRRDNGSIKWFYENVGRQLAENEIEVLKDALVKGSTNRIKATTNGILTKADISTAVSRVSDNHYYPDRLLLHPKHKVQLAKEDTLYMLMLLSPTRERPPHYAGQIDGLDVYWNAGLKGLALTFESLEITFARTKPKVEADVASNPTKLYVSCWCSCAPVDERSVAIIEV